MERMFAWHVMIDALLLVLIIASEYSWLACPAVLNTHHNARAISPKKTTAVSKLIVVPPRRPFVIVFVCGLISFTDAANQSVVAIAHQAVAHEGYMFAVGRPGGDVHRSLATEEPGEDLGFASRSRHYSQRYILVRRMPLDLFIV